MPPILQCLLSFTFLLLLLHNFHLLIHYQSTSTTATTTTSITTNPSSFLPQALPTFQTYNCSQHLHIPTPSGPPSLSLLPHSPFLQISTASLHHPSFPQTNQHVQTNQPTLHPPTPHLPFTTPPFPATAPHPTFSLTTLPFAQPTHTILSPPTHQPTPSTHPLICTDEAYLPCSPFVLRATHRPLTPCAKTD